MPQAALRPTLLLALLAALLLPALPARARPLEHEDAVPRLVLAASMPEWLQELLREGDAKPAVGFERWLDGDGGESEEPEDEVEARPEPVNDPWTLVGAPVPWLEVARTKTGATSAGWSYVGPTATYWSQNENAAQPLRPLQANIRGFAVAPSNPSVLYAGSQLGALSKSTDKGLTWTPIGVNDTLLRTGITAITVHPNDPNIVYVGNGRGIVKSTDGGVSWTLSLDYPPVAANTIVLKPDQPETVLVAGSTFLAKTPTSNWNGAFGRVTYDVAYRPGNANIGYALIQNVAGDSIDFYKTTNGGNSWTRRRTGWSAHIGPYLGGRIAVTPAAPDRIYALVTEVEGSRLLRSDDAGETWVTKAFSPVGVNANNQCEPAVGPFILDNCQGYYDQAIAASPLDANQIVLGTCYAFRSMDGGNTFVSISECVSQYLHADLQHIVCIGGDSWVASDGGVTLSTDFWTTTTNFSARTIGLRGTQIWGFGQGWNEDAIVSGRNHNAIGAWVEGYPAGTFLSTSSGEPVTGFVNPADNRMSYASVFPGGIRWPSTFNGAITTFAVAKLPADGSAVPGNEMNAGEVEWDPRFARTFYVGRNDGLWRTEDNGTTFQLVWKHADPAAVEQHIEVSRTDPNVLYVTVRLGASGELWKSVDRGKTWTQCANPAGLSAAQRQLGTIAVSGTSSNELWWCFRNGPNGNKIYKSADGGASWSNLTTPALDGVVLVNMFHQLGTSGGIYLVGQYGAVLYRNDLMPDWVAYNTGLPSALGPDMAWGAIQYPKQVLRLGTTQGIWEAPLYEPSTTTLVQPMVAGSATPGPCDTLQFESYSVANGPATYQWTFSPAAAYVSDANARNPRVVFGSPGSHAATLAITDLNGTTSRTIRNLVNVDHVQYADSVIAVSSEYTLSGPPQWYAIQALGLPDTYPDYGDLPTSWASLHEDEVKESITLHYATPAAIDFVQVFETFNPGALYRVSVKNPNTGNFVLVWSAPAVPAPQAARVYTARFPYPGFLVDQVQLEFDSPAVPGWNEIDAVGIGTQTCTASLVSVPGSPASPLVSGIDRVHPNPFVAFTSIRCVLARPGTVQADVYDVMGHRVAPLANHYMLAGTHELRWDGRDAAGRDMASGIYYVRVRGAGVDGSTRVVKLH